jgi:hypothetical protein
MNCVALPVLKNGEGHQPLRYGSPVPLAAEVLA